MSTAIEFNNVSKQYKLGLVSTKTLSHDLNRWWQTKILGKEDPYLKIGSVNDRSAKADSDYVWALKDIDFKVEQGDVVGIIGKNGAGKSTLLKLLSRVTNPTTGTIRARGRIASLLEVGTGFHPELTGRENIYMNGSIMGMNKAEITSKLDEIVAFSGCERYIDTPVKRYSSGMTVRLGFAIAAHLDPEILVVDEVLAVGDAEFQKKAIGKMKDVSKGDGRTVLFVSHNMASMHQLCKNGILMDKGEIIYKGMIDDVIGVYQKDALNIQNVNLLNRTDREGNGRIRIESIQLRDVKGNNLDYIRTGDSCFISVNLYSYNWTKSDEIEQVTIAINDNFGNRAIVMSNTFINKSVIINPSNELTTITYVLEKFPLVAGDYSMAFYLSDKFGNVIDWIDNIYTITVHQGDFYKSGNYIRKGLGQFLINFDIE